MPTLRAQRPDDYLQRVADSAVGRAYKATVVAQAEPAAGLTVLDVGCGPGADLAAFATAVGPGGRVIGLDSDIGSLRQARERTSGLRGVAVVAGDAHLLPMPDGSVDRVHTDRVLQHVERPSDAVAEVERVLAPGGLAVLAEPDWDTLVIDHPDPSVPDAYRRFVTDRVVRNSRIGRGLPGLCVRQDLHVRRVVPLTAVYLDVTEADEVLGLRRVTSRAVDAGHLSEADATTFLDHLVSEPFFASVTIFVTVAEKSPVPVGDTLTSAG